MTIRKHDKGRCTKSRCEKNTAVRVKHASNVNKTSNNLPPEFTEHKKGARNIAL